MLTVCPIVIPTLDKIIMMNMNATVGAQLAIRSNGMRRICLTDCTQIAAPGISLKER